MNKLGLLVSLSFFFCLSSYRSLGCMWLLFCTSWLAVWPSSIILGVGENFPAALGMIIDFSVWRKNTEPVSPLPGIHKAGALKELLMSVGTHVRAHLVSSDVGYEASSVSCGNIWPAVYFVLIGILSYISMLKAHSQSIEDKSQTWVLHKVRKPSIFIPCFSWKADLLLLRTGTVYIAWSLSKIFSTLALLGSSCLFPMRPLSIIIQTTSL